jgi:signal transduction histidine kinase
MLAPLQSQGRLLGIIGLGRHAPGKNYPPEDLPFLQDIADRSTLAMLNAQMYEELEQELVERKRVEAEIRKINEELGSKNEELERFTYTVSHDLKAPLVTINGFLGYLEQDAQSGDTERLQSDIHRIQDATKKMQRLLNELLELSRVGRMVNPSETIPFTALAQDALDLVHGQLEKGGIAVELDPNLPAIYGDRQRLTEVLQNLIENAAKFMGEQPQPRIEIGQQGEEDGKPVFFVRDNGIGIEPEYHERVFGLFEKLNTNTEGTGIGLALVKRIIEFHGGRIWVESEAGKGTTFCFTLPKKQEKSDGKL